MDSPNLAGVVGIRKLQGWRGGREEWPPARVAVRLSGCPAVRPSGCPAVLLSCCLALQPQLALLLYSEGWNTGQENPSEAIVYLALSRTFVTQVHLCPQPAGHACPTPGGGSLVAGATAVRDACRQRRRFQRDAALASRRSCARGPGRWGLGGWSKRQVPTRPRDRLRPRPRPLPPLSALASPQCAPPPALRTPQRASPGTFGRTSCLSL